MALGSNAPRCAAGDCPEQLRFDVHQLHRVGLLMVSRALIVSPRRWRNGEWLCMATRGDGLLSTAANFSFPAHAPAKGVEQGFNREPRTIVWRWSALQGDARIRKARIYSVLSLPAFTTKG